MVDFKFFGVINPTERESRAGDPVPAAGTPYQAADKSRLAATQVRAQLYDFAAAQAATQQLAESLGIVGAYRAGLPDHFDTHTGHILRLIRRCRQVWPDAGY